MSGPVFPPIPNPDENNIVDDTGTEIRKIVVSGAITRNYYQTLGRSISGGSGGYMLPFNTTITPFIASSATLGRPDESEEMLVPDSIDPVIGWRAMGFDGTHLRSPARSTRWPIREPLQAKCANSNQHGYWRWVIAYDQVPTSDQELQELKAGMAVSSSTPTNYTQIPPRPTTVLTKGVYVLEWHVPVHHSPDPKCGCGIYMVTHPNTEVEAYTRHSGVHSGAGFTDIQIVAKTAAWGRVVPGTTGWRAEYAYPQELWVIGCTDELEQRLQAYGVPIIKVGEFRHIGAAQAMGFSIEPQGLISGSTLPTSPVAVTKTKLTGHASSAPKGQSFLPPPIGKRPSEVAKSVEIRNLERFILPRLRRRKQGS